MTVIGGVPVVTWQGHQTVYGTPVRGSARSIGFLQFLDDEARAQGLRVAVIQSAFNTTVPESAGTHDYDACYDLQIVGLSWDDAQSWLRRRGFACWHRTPAQGDWGDHIHGIVLGYTTKVGIYVPGQVTDYHNHALGLAGQHEPGSDPTWHPDPQFVFDYQKWLDERSRDMPGFGDTIPGTTVTYGQLCRRQVRALDAVPKLRVQLAQVADDVEKLGDSATADQVSKFRLAMRDRIKDLRESLEQLQDPPPDETTTKETP
jgi:hypothetical protein